MFVVKKQAVLADHRGRRAVSSIVRVGGGSGDGATKEDATDTSTTAHAEVFDVASKSPPSWWPKKLDWPPSSTAPKGWTTKWPPTNEDDLSAGLAAMAADEKAAKNEEVEEIGKVEEKTGPGSVSPSLAIDRCRAWGFARGKEDAAARRPSDAGAAVLGSYVARDLGDPDLVAKCASAIRVGYDAGYDEVFAMTPGQRDAVATGLGAVVGGVVAKLVAGVGAAAFGPIAFGAVLGAVFGHAFHAMATGNPLTSVATKG